MFSAVLPISDIRREHQGHAEGMAHHLDEPACVRVSATGRVDPSVSGSSAPLGPATNFSMIAVGKLR